VCFLWSDVAFSQWPQHACINANTVHNFSSLFADDNLCAISFSLCLKGIIATVDFRNSKNTAFTQPTMCCVITATITNSNLFVHLAKSAAFL